MNKLTGLLILTLLTACTNTPENNPNPDFPSLNACATFCNERNFPNARCAPAEEGGQGDSDVGTCREESIDECANGMCHCYCRNALNTTMENEKVLEPIYKEITEEETTITVQPQDTLILTLESNVTTGFRWDAEFQGGALVLNDRTYIESGDADHVGASGMDQFTFEALKEGEATLTFSYRRQWEKGVPPAEVRTVKVNVEELW